MAAASQNLTSVIGTTHFWYLLDRFGKVYDYNNNNHKDNNNHNNKNNDSWTRTFVMLWVDVGASGLGSTLQEVEQLLLLEM